MTDYQRVLERLHGHLEWQPGYLNAEEGARMNNLAKGIARRASYLVFLRTLDAGPLLVDECIQEINLLLDKMDDLEVVNEERAKHARLN